MNTPLPSRGLSGYVGAVLAGIISAALFSFARTHAEMIVVFLAYLTPLPLFLAGLGAGPRASLAAAVSATVALVAMQYAFGSANIIAEVGAYILVVVLPATLLSIIALRYRIVSVSQVSQDALWTSEGVLLSLAVLYPCFIFVAAVAATWHVDGGLLHLSMNFLNSLTEPIKQQWAKDGKIDADMLLNFDTAIASTARMLPAMMTWSWVIVIMVMGIIAQRMLTQNNWQLRTSLRLKNFYVPSAILYGAAVTGLIAIFAPSPYSYIGLNLCMILFMPITMDGIAVMHATARRTRFPLVVITLFYVTLFILHWPIVVVALLGVLDQWMNFRKRLASGTETAN
jgi:hypothetical protein